VQLSCRGPLGSGFVDEVTIVDDTAYSVNVDVTDAERNGWLDLTTVGRESTRTVEEVIDQGEVWLFRFDYVDIHQEEVEVSRGELKQNDGTIEVTRGFQQRLRELAVPPPP
jgi:hypothetical protein